MMTQQIQEYKGNNPVDRSPHELRYGHIFSLDGNVCIELFSCLSNIVTFHTKVNGVGASRALGPELLYVEEVR